MTHTHTALLKLETSIAGDLVRLVYGSLLTLFGLPVVVTYGVLYTMLTPLVAPDQSVVDSSSTP